MEAEGYVCLHMVVHQLCLERDQQKSLIIQLLQIQLFERAKHP